MLLRLLQNLIDSTRTHTTHNVDSKSERLSSSFSFEPCGQTTGKQQNGFAEIRLWFWLVQVYSSANDSSGGFLSIEVDMTQYEALFQFSKWHALKIFKHALSFPDQKQEHSIWNQGAHLGQSWKRNFAPKKIQHGTHSKEVALRLQIMKQNTLWIVTFLLATSCTDTTKRFYIFEPWLKWRCEDFRNQNNKNFWSHPPHRC